MMDGDGGLYISTIPNAYAIGVLVTNQKHAKALLATYDERSRERAKADERGASEQKRAGAGKHDRTRARSDEQTNGKRTVEPADGM